MSRRVRFIPDRGSVVEVTVRTLQSQYLLRPSPSLNEVVGQAILVSEEEPAQVERLRYLLAHGVKEGLVAHARDWPGVHSIREILAGEPIRGLWFDRTKEFAARNRGESFQRLTYATEEALVLSPLPCWAHLSPEAYRQRVADLVEAIEIEAATALAASGRVPLGVAGVLRVLQERSPLWWRA